VNKQILVALFGRGEITPMRKPLAKVRLENGQGLLAVVPFLQQGTTGKKYQLLRRGPEALAF
jgi:hypothetical protein